MTKTVTDRYDRRPTWVRRRLVNPLFRVLVLRAGKLVERPEAPEAAAA